MVALVFLEGPHSHAPLQNKQNGDYRIENTINWSINHQRSGVVFEEPI